MRKFSVQAAELYEDEFFDWVYLDVDHSYEAVVSDSAAWWPKVKPGGIFSGHDIVHDGFYPTARDFGVTSAVMEFAASHGLQLQMTFEEMGVQRVWHLVPGSCTTMSPSWYLRKPLKGRAVEGDATAMPPVGLQAEQHRYSSQAALA